MRKKSALHYTVAYWEDWNLDTDYLTVTDLSEAFEIVEGRLRIPGLDGAGFEDEQKGENR